MFSPPHFMIIGAPKCGTTSLVAWLSAHPNIFLTSPKEPAHFSTDIKTIGAVRNPQKYAALFAGAAPHQLTGEASTTYLRSHDAVPAVLNRRPDTQFIVCLRNPVEMMPSVHMQLFRGGRENLADPKAAWGAQAERRQGRNLPSICPEPADLNYSTVCSLGAQVTRLLEAVPRSQVHFILNEDMRASPRSVYQETLNFLNITDDGRSDFENLNARSTPRFAIVSQVIARASLLRRKVWQRRMPLGLGALAAKLNTPSTAPALSIDPDFRALLIDHFARDVEVLAGLTGKNLTGWCR